MKLPDVFEICPDPPYGECFLFKKSEQTSPIIEKVEPVIETVQSSAMGFQVISVLLLSSLFFVASKYRKANS